ncbi:MAG: ABC transporter substrate-binding protein [Pseudomonadota bacterium]
MRALVLAATLALGGCVGSYAELTEARRIYAGNGEGPVVVAVIDDPERPRFVLGAQLAAAEINGTEGGVLGRPLEVRVVAEATTLRGLLGDASALAADPSVSAVMGHARSQFAVAASVVYEASSILFFPSFSTDPRLTVYGPRYVLQMVPNAQVMAEQTASIAALFGYRRIVVLHSRDEYSRSVAFLFEDEARKQGIDIAFRGSFFQGETNYRDVVGDLNAIAFDAVYVATDTASGATLLTQLRELGHNKPILGSDHLATGDLAAEARRAGNLTVTPVTYAERERTRRNFRFRRTFREAFGEEPGAGAAQGYDSMRLFATIAERAGSTEPTVLSAVAHFTAPVMGVTGLQQFNQSGEIQGKSYRFQVLRDGRQAALPGIIIPFKLRPFETTIDLGETVLSATDDVSSAEEVADQAVEAAANEAELTTDTLADLDERLRNKISWVGVAKDILKFDRLGVVDLQTPTTTTTITLARTAAKQYGFELDVCVAPRAEAPGDEGAAPNEEPAEGDALVGRSEIFRRVLTCYSDLTGSVDAVFVTAPQSDDAPDMRRLNRSLRDFTVPTFAVDETLDADLGLTLAIEGSGIDLTEPRTAIRFQGLLVGKRVRDLSEELSKLPAISIDLGAFEDMSIRLPPVAVMAASQVLADDDQ